MGLYRVKTTRPDGTKYVSPNWRGKFKHPETGRWEYVATNTADKAAAKLIFAEAIRRAAKEYNGTANPHADHFTRLLAEHVADWHKAVLAKGNTARHADLVTARVKRVFDDCGFTRWPQIVASKVEGKLAEYRAGSEETPGMSVQTSNFYLQAVKQFCRWMVKDGRAPASPVVHLEGGNVKTDRRHDRRALTADELRTLLAKTETEPERFGMTGRVRALVYRLAVETGLRAGEIRSLTVSGFDLDGDPPSVTVQAAYAKNRRADTLPLRPALAASIARWFAETGRSDPQASAFNMPVPDKVVRFMKADLAAAGVEYETPDGFADFHALRHTFISNLARGGVTPKVAQDLARHSDINLTLSRYTHTLVADRAAALAALPDLSAPAAQQTAKAAQQRRNKRAAG